MFLRVLLVVVACLAPMSARAGEALVTARRERWLKAPKEARINALFGLSELWEQLDDATPIVRFLDEVRSTLSEHPQVRAYATYVASLARERLGKSEEAAALRRELGFVERFWILGPFDNEGRAGFTSHPPFETQVRAPAFDPARAAPVSGKERPISWRQLPADAVRGGRVALDTMLRPDHDAFAYATTWMRVPSRGRVALFAGSSGPIQVWVDDALVVERGEYRRARVDQDAGVAELSAGWHRIFVKVAANEGEWVFYLRAVRETGAPLPDREIALAPTGKVAQGKASKIARAVPGLEPQLRARARAARGDAMLALAEYLHFATPVEAGKHEAEELLEKVVASTPGVRAFSLLARVHHDPNEQRLAIERALALPGLSAAERVRLLVARGDGWLRAGREARAEAAWNEALTVSPQAEIPRLRLAELAADRGLPARGQQILDGVREKSSAPMVLRALAKMASRRSDTNAAVELYEKIIARNAADMEALAQLFSIERWRGEIARAVATSDRIFALEGQRSYELVATIEMLEAAGRTREAITRVERALANVPEDARLLELAGKLLHRMGDDKQAMTRFHQALAVRPQNPELRAYIASFGTGGQDSRIDQLIRAHRVDTAPILARVRANKNKEKTDEPSRVLLDSKVIRVHGNGLSDTYQQRVVQVFDERAARELDDYDIRYSPDTQTVDVRAARIYKPSGEQIEVALGGERDLSEPWYGLYYDVRARMITLAGLAPGDVYEIEYVVSDVGRQNFIADYFGDMHFLQEERPRLESRYTIVAPEGRTLFFNSPGLQQLKRDVVTRDGERVYSFVARDVPKIDAEPQMPGFSDVAAYVHASTFRSWGDVASFYRAWVREQLIPDAAVKRAAKQAVQGKKTEREKVAAIYEYVVRATRYVGLEFGVHGYKPYRVGQVLARKFGDCKDKAGLLVAMLKEVGIDATMVLVRTRRGGDVQPEPASLAPFDHAIAYVPTLKLYLDGTAEFSGPEELPAQDQNVSVLLVDTGVLTHTPEGEARRNFVRDELKVVLDPDGTASFDEKMTIAGQAAHEWRAHYQTEGERLEHYEKAWNARRPGAKVTSVEMPTVQDRLRPVEVRAKIRAERWAVKESASRIALPLYAREVDLLRSYARLSERKQELLVSYPWTQEDELDVRLPDGFVVDRAPEDIALSGKFGAFSLKVRKTEGGVKVSAHLEVTKNRVPVKDYSAFRDFLSKIDAAAAQTVLVVRK